VYLDSFYICSEIPQTTCVVQREAELVGKLGLEFLGVKVLKTSSSSPASPLVLFKNS
jgi:hypothetical protein